MRSSSSSEVMILAGMVNGRVVRETVSRDSGRGRKSRKFVARNRPFSLFRNTLKVAGRKRGKVSRRAPRLANNAGSRPMQKNVRSSGQGSSIGVGELSGISRGFLLQWRLASAKYEEKNVPKKTLALLTPQLSFVLPISPPFVPFCSCSSFMPLLFFSSQPTQKLKASQPPVGIRLDPACEEYGRVRSSGD